MVPAARKNHFLGWCLFVLPKTSQRGISMSGIVPSLGRIVWFYARRYQAEQISKRRADAARELDYHRWKKNGAMIHVGNPVEAGQIVPAMIVAVWGDKQPGSFLKGSGPDDTQRARTAPAAPGAR
jgi:hypothetical protein